MHAPKEYSVFVEAQTYIFLQEAELGLKVWLGSNILPGMHKTLSLISRAENKQKAVNLWQMDPR